MRLQTFPVRLRLELSASRCGMWEAIVDEDDAMSNENLGLDCDTLASKGMTRNLTTLANLGALLDFNEGSYPRVIANFAAVEIDEAADTDIAPQLHIRRNQLRKGRSAAHAAVDRLDIAGTDGTDLDPEAAPLAFGKVTGAPLAFSEAEAASRIRTISSPAEPPLTGTVSF